MDDQPSQEAAPDEVSSEPTASQAMLAATTTSDGSQFSFVRFESGDLGVSVMARHPVRVSNLLGDSDTPLSELYERLSGSSAPAELISAERELATQRGKDVREQALGDEPKFSSGSQELSASTQTGVGVVQQALTATEFSNMFCQPSKVSNPTYDTLWCWPDTGGNPYVQAWAFHFEGSMSATNCATRFRYRYKSGSTWYTWIDRQALQGEWWSYYQLGEYRHRRFEILNNDGCGVRFEAFKSG